MVLYMLIPPVIFARADSLFVHPPKADCHIEKYIVYELLLLVSGFVKYLVLLVDVM